ncbi:odorant receptor 23a-like [Hermetia illucens]|uniref:odorant receptor 23a-like n=1 Tax=Hermetia illucens TaxID=343691 RepID=UPI0018CC5FAD|nr:odorant receptor 23a-like [Hermetia illucens]
MDVHSSESIFNFLFACARLIIPLREHGITKRILIILYFLITNGALLLCIGIEFYATERKDIIKHILEFVAVFVAFWKFTDFLLKVDKMTTLTHSILELEKEINDAEMEGYLSERISFGKNLCRVFMTLKFWTWIGALISVLLTKQLAFPMWFPLDWEGSTLNYYIVVSFQFVSYAGLVFQDTISDLTRLMYVLIMSGHLHALGIKVSRIGYTDPYNWHNNNVELNKCIQRHQIIIRIVDELNAIISKTYLVVLIVVEINICGSFYQVLFLGEEAYMKACLIAYAVSLSISTGLQCFFGSEIQDKSERFMEAIYCCNWPDQDQKFKKSLLILMTRSRKDILIMAGGVMPVSLPTCLVVFKSSYSLFALLQQMNR